MELKVIKTRSKAFDIATQMEGTVTHWTVNMSKQVKYLFQPRGTHPKTGQPLKRYYIDEKRLKLDDKNSSFEIVNVPFDVLGSQVEDGASGFKGMAVEFMMHTNGCFHVYIQPSEIIEATGLPAEKDDFDLRSCIGEKIQVLTEEQHLVSVEDKPSPVEGASDVVKDSTPKV